VTPTPDVARAEELAEKLMIHARADALDKVPPGTLSAYTAATLASLLSLVRDLARERDRMHAAIGDLLTKPATVSGMPSPYREEVETALREIQAYLRAALPPSPDATDDRSTR
jgi:hypothetical protein